MRFTHLHLVAAGLFLLSGAFVVWVAFQFGMEQESILQSEQTIQALDALAAS